MLFRSAISLHLEALSKLRTVWLPTPLVYSETGFCYLIVTFLLNRKRYYSYRCLYIRASLFDVRSIIYIEIGSNRLSLSLIYIRTNLIMLLKCSKGTY